MSLFCILKSTKLNLGTEIGHPDWAFPLISPTLPVTCLQYCLTAGYDWFLHRPYQSRIRRHKLQADGLSLAKFLLRFLCRGKNIYTDTDTDTHTHTHTHIYIYIYIYIYIPTLTHIYTNIYVCQSVSQYNIFSSLWRILLSQFCFEILKISSIPLIQL
jgi:hypothetical protein